MMRLQVSLTMALMMTAGAASAAPNDPICSWIPWFPGCSAPVSPSPKPLVAPEIDPSSALAGLSLLAGGLLVLRGRRIKATDA